LVRRKAVKAKHKEGLDEEDIAKGWIFVHTWGVGGKGGRGTQSPHGKKGAHQKKCDKERRDLRDFQTTDWVMPDI